MVYSFALASAIYYILERDPFAVQSPVVRKDSICWSVTAKGYGLNKLTALTLHETYRAKSQEEDNMWKNGNIVT